MKKAELRPREKHIEGVGVREFRQWYMKAYYYRVTIPQDINADSTIALFCGHIGDLQWTNIPRDRMFAEFDQVILYKVSLVVKPNEDTRIFDVISALQHGHLTIRNRGQEFVSEPLSFFPVNIYAEIAGRERDPLARLAVQTLIPRPETLDEDTSKRLMNAITGLDIPLFIPDTETIDGEVDLDKALFGSPEFGLFVVLHTVTSYPLRDE